MKTRVLGTFVLLGVLASVTSSCLSLKDRNASEYKIVMLRYELLPLKSRLKADAAMVPVEICPETDYDWTSTNGLVSLMTNSSDRLIATGVGFVTRDNEWGQCEVVNGKSTSMYNVRLHADTMTIDLYVCDKYPGGQIADVVWCTNSPFMFDVVVGTSALNAVNHVFVMVQSKKATTAGVKADVAKVDNTPIVTQQDDTDLRHDTKAATPAPSYLIDVMDPISKATVVVAVDEIGKGEAASNTVCEYAVEYSKEGHPIRTKKQNLGTKIAVVSLAVTNGVGQTEIFVESTQVAGWSEQVIGGKTVKQPQFRVLSDHLKGSTVLDSWVSMGGTRVGSQSNEWRIRCRLGWTRPGTDCK